MPLPNLADATLKQESLSGSKQMVKRVKFAESRVKGLNRFPGKVCTSFSGFVDGDLININPAYRIVIFARLGGSSEVQCITSILQEETTLRVTSDWEPFIPTGVTAFFEGVVQSVSSLGGRPTSLVNRFTTRRIWRGTSPIELTINLKFESISDTFKNVVKPVMQLMQITSPALTGVPGKANLLTPPGPNAFRRAFSVGEIEEQNIKGDIPIGDTISIRIGTFLNFNSVIIKEVVPVFDNRLSPDGYPISAKVAVIFQTYEVLTKSDIENTLFKPESSIEKSNLKI